MFFKDLTFAQPQENIDYDETLWHLAEKEGGGEALRFWESEEIFIVMGLTGKEEDDVNLAQTKKDGVAVLRRSSGGGTVVQGPGCLNYCLVLCKQKRPEINDLRRSYEWISGRVIEALGRCGVEAYFRPLSDLATGKAEKKFSGNAQRRGKNFVMHHGTILYNFNLELIGRYLKMPKDVPDYRKGRSHLDFVTNISLDPTLFKQNLIQIFQ